MMTRRRLITVLVLMALPALAAALWARSYSRRDLLLWGMNRSGARRIECRAYSSWGRLGFCSYSHPAGVDTGSGTGAPEFHSGDRASTEPMAVQVRAQLQQAGLINVNVLGFGYSQHVGALSTGDHVWTAAVVPWWFVTLAMLAALAYAAVRRRRPNVREGGDGAAPAAPGRART